MRIIRTALAGALLGAMANVSSALAEGALAIGATGDIVKDGIAFGYMLNARTGQAARDAAMGECREGTVKVASRCEVVATLRGECLAIAMDPGAGTPGFGFAMGPQKADAEQRALAICRLTAGAGRSRSCSVTQSGCDVGN